MNELNEILVKAVGDILIETMKKVAENLPDDADKKNFLNRLDAIIREGLRETINTCEYEDYMRCGVYETSVWLANHYADVAIERIIAEMPPGKTRNTVNNSLQEIKRIGIEGFCGGNSLNQIKNSLRAYATNQFKTYAAGESQRLANEAVNFLNKNLSQKLADNLGTQLNQNINEVIYNNKSISDAVVDVTVNTAKKQIAGATYDILNEAMQNVAELMPDEYSQTIFINQVTETLKQSIHTAINSGDYQQVLKQGAYAIAKDAATHYTNVGIKQMIKKIPEGEARDVIQSSLEELTYNGIESLCRGDSLDEIQQELANCAKNQVRGKLKEYVSVKSKPLTQEAEKMLYSTLKTSGKGSRSRNRQLKIGTGIVGQELQLQIINNFSEVIDGNKKISDAAVDITFDTAKNSAKTYIKGQGAQIAADAIKNLTKLAQKEIENELARNTITNTLKKFASKNALIENVGTLIDIGKSLKMLMEGKITKTQFLKIAGEKGTAAVVSSAFATMGTLVAGPVGGVILANVGYFATNCLYGSVLQAFNEAELSRKQYEAVHKFCEYSIREKERQRLEFEAKVKDFLEARQFVIDTNLDNYEHAIKNNDFDSMSSALNNIAEEFGGELQFKTKKEFIDFMNDKDSVFEL